MTTYQPLSCDEDPPPVDCASGLTPTDAQRIATAMKADLAPATRATYACGWRQWEQWRGARGITPLPAPPEALAAFMTGKAEGGLHFTTIDAYCSGVAHMHRLAGLADPTADAVVRRVRRGLRRIMGVAPRRPAHPLTVSEVAQIVRSIDVTTATGKRDRALILVGYASAMRPGELSALDVEDVLRRPTGLLLRIRRSKTDQEARGQLVGIARGRQIDTDPVSALDAWLDARSSTEGALFTRVLYRNYAMPERLGASTISRMVRERAAAAGLGHVAVKGHSLRAGHATTAAINGASIVRIAAQTRHRDLATLMNHYIRPAEAMATTTSKDLGL